MKNTLTLGDLKNLNLPIYVHCAFNTYKVKRVIHLESRNCLILETGDIYNFDNFFTEEPDDNYPGAA
jgi:hypothetical protein